MVDRNDLEKLSFLVLAFYQCISVNFGKYIGNRRRNVILFKKNYCNNEKPIEQLGGPKKRKTYYYEPFLDTGNYQDNIAAETQ